MATLLRDTTGSPGKHSKVTGEPATGEPARTTCTVYSPMAVGAWRHSYLVSPLLMETVGSSVTTSPDAVSSVTSRSPSAAAVSLPSLSQILGRTATWSPAITQLLTQLPPPCSFECIVGASAACSASCAPPAPPPAADERFGTCRAHDATA